MLTLSDCILTRNVADGGGGLYNNGGTVSIIYTTFDGNIAGHPGGGLFNFHGTVTITNSTFVHNVADGGGGIFNGGFGNQSMATVTLTNTTVAENRGSPNGFGTGGIVNSGFAVLQSTTVAENSGSPSMGTTGGITNLGTLLLQNSIIAHNHEGRPFFGAPDCSGAVTSLGNNLIGDLTECTVTLEPSDLTGDPGLRGLHR